VPMRIDYNSEGKWSVTAVESRYTRLRTKLGNVTDFELKPRAYTNSRGMTWLYNIMESAVEGVRRGDPACIELSVEYIEDNVMGSYTGYIRERLARSLRHAELSNSQRTRLINVFLSQLARGYLHQEFREYSRLFKSLGIDDHRSNIGHALTSEQAYIRRAAERLLA
jgi:hypothetical protein